ncbi:MAG: glycosyltransferase family 39 protein, partial [Anaerolineales bacterium]|nr:glycosyltransferase family 39 protein [Anaerolineales bacterium]
KREGDGPTAVNTPLYFTLTTLLSQLVGLSDATVRLVPALAGVALVASPVLFRRWLGNAGMLISSLLLAISPLATLTARTANGDALTMLAAMGLAAGWLNWQATGEKRWQTVTAVSLGLGLATSPLFYTALVTVGGAWWLTQKWGVGSRESGETPHTPHPTPYTLLFPTLLTFLTAATLFLWYPAGLGAAAQVAGQWLGQFGLVGNIADPYLVLLRYELPVLLGLVWGIISSKNEIRDWRLESANLHQSPIPNLQSLLTLWLLLTLILMPLQAGQNSNALLVILPAYLLVGHLGSRLFAQPLHYLTSWLAGGLVFLAMLAFVNFARYLKLASINSPALSHLWFTSMGAIIAVFALYMIWTWGETSAVYQGTVLALLGLFVFYQWGLGWGMAQRWGNDPRERWVQTATDGDIRLLVQLVQDVSRQGAGSDSDLELFSAVDSPLLRWYLRPFPRA